MKQKNFNSFFLLLLFFFSVSSVLARQREILLTSVIAPDSVRYALACVQVGKNYLEGDDSLYMAVDIVNYESPKDRVFKDGIYGWRVFGPHFPVRLFIYNKGRLQIFKSITINELLQEYSDYLKISDLCEPLRIRYLVVISKYLQGTYENEHGKIDGKRRKK